MIEWNVKLKEVSRMFFVFQAEDGIRDSPVTGVQTCALPIYTKALAMQLHKSKSKFHRPIG